MNRTLKKLIFSEQKRLLTLVVIFVIALMLSALIFLVTEHENFASINYLSISKLTLTEIFLKTLKKNIIYFMSIILLTCIGKSNIINGLFGLISIYYGLSVIYMIRAMQFNKVYFIFIFTDYFIFFPLLFYFTYISSSVSKYTKKTKNVETISHKFDIIISSYIKLSFIYIGIVIAYSFSYSYFILLLSRLLVR